MKMKLAVIALLALVLLVMGSPAMGQTTYNLPNNPNGNVDFIDYGTYANLFDADIPVTINGVPFLVTITAHFMPDNEEHSIGSARTSKSRRGAHQSLFLRGLPIEFVELSRSESYGY
jgi:hypothetical protein